MKTWDTSDSEATLETPLQQRSYACSSSSCGGVITLLNEGPQHAFFQMFFWELTGFV